jgi:heptosyltransferase II
MKIRPEEVKRLLVRGTNWVGDAVMSVPTLKEIRRIFPRAHISILVRPWVSDVYSAVDFVDSILAYDSTNKHKGWIGKMRLAGELRREAFDAAILLQNAFDAAALTWMAGIPLRIGYARDLRSPLLTHACRIDPAVRSVHQVYYYLGILAGVGLFPNRSWNNHEYRPSISIAVSKEDQAAAASLLRSEGISGAPPLVGINPGAAYGSAKRWFSDRYSQLADQLVERYKVRILLFGSAGERLISERVAQGMKNPATVLAGRTTLGQLMGLLSLCRLLITNDSGPMHLAAALNVPQLAIFGSTSEIATGPLSENAEVVKNQVDCNPCFLRECPIDFRCMTGITVDRVYNRAASKLEG